MDVVAATVIGTMTISTIYLAMFAGVLSYEARDAIRALWGRR